ncbi:hypothetical protein HJG53_11735 [Sphingomonas sp. ID1715]|uniref:hypothetical protein n=1 Tax=Sphingomonas sp. ID1715 TaxID=1656898 RepID=UPI001487B90F|nr:hypothetical protein [Sphingomonas sp. ID1715]NNM77580.1 hypothetical protein [Sphingomonas sp. ID1715]
MMSDAAALREKAEKCRRLADAIRDPIAVEGLSKLAEEMDRQAAALEPDPKTSAIG